VLTKSTEPVALSSASSELDDTLTFRLVGPTDVGLNVGVNVLVSKGVLLGVKLGVGVTVFVGSSVLVGVELGVDVTVEVEIGVTVEV
jgi:hypothetical protein